MRKWQQDLVLDGTESKEITPKIEEKTLMLTDVHICAILFIFSMVILLVFKPPLILSRNKDRPEETTSLNWYSIIILCTCVSSVYWGLQNKIF